MLLTPHVVVGAAIGSQIRDPYITGAISFGSHFVLDKIPHWQETLYPYTPTKKTWIRIFIEVIFVLIFIYFLAKRGLLNTNVIVGMVASILPDIDSFAIINKKLMGNKFVKAYFDWHSKIQNETSKFYGVLTQLAIIALGLIIISY